MALPWIIANLAAGNQPASKLDDNFNALGAIATIPCVATGTNAITLTPAALTPAVAAYAQLQAYRGVAAATATGAITARVGALAFLPCYVSGAAAPVAATTGNTVIGDCYDFVYDVALNSGAGGFHIYNAFSTPFSTGSFTPTISFGGSSASVVYALQAGLYQIIGSRLFFSLQIVLTNNGTGVGAAVIDGIPFAAPASPAVRSVHTVAFVVAAGLTTVAVEAHTSPSQTAINLNRQTITGLTAITDVECGNTLSVVVEGNYSLV